MERIQQVQKRTALTRCLRFSSLIIIASSLSACANNYVKREVAFKETPLTQSQQTIPESQLLAVRVESFEVGALPQDPNLAKGLSPEIRNAESYFFAVQLKNTMQRSGHWGPVRVTPKDMRDGEVNVAGHILESDGEILKLEIRVEDATGREWFTKQYSSVIDDKIYDKMRAQGLEAYQHLYNEIANDIAQHKQKIAAEDAEKIRKVAELRFGQDFAPKIFDGYLQNGPASEPKKNDDALAKLTSLFTKTESESGKPKFQIVRLPPDNDPLIDRVNRIRAREEFLVDTLDQNYDSLADRLSPAYLQWRRSRLQEIYAIRESDKLENQKQGEAVAIGFLGILAGAAVGSQRNCYTCKTAGAAVAATAVAIAANHAIQASNKAKADTDMRKLALEELGRSLMTEVQPTVIEVEGQTVELKGTVDQKMVQWSAVLEELREKEIGPLVSIEPAAGS
jgi:hypothetical protein